MFGCILRFIMPVAADSGTLPRYPFMTVGHTPFARFTVMLYPRLCAGDVGAVHSGVLRGTRHAIQLARRFAKMCNIARINTLSIDV